MRWTPDKDQLLLRKLLETHQFTVDTKIIAEAWPEDDDKPTARAITERLVKIRKDGKANGTSGNFSVASGKAKKTFSTPRKPMPALSSGYKRNPNGVKVDVPTSIKREEDDSEGGSAHAATAYPTPPRRKSNARAHRASYMMDEETDSEDALPSIEKLLTPNKKMKTRGKKVAVYQSDGEGHDDSDISEFGISA